MADTVPLTFVDQTIDVDAPSAGRHRLYSKSAGLFWRTSSAIKRLLTEDDLGSSPDHPDGLEAFGDPVDRLQVARMLVYGHSLPAGAGSSDPDRDIMTHLASMMKIREINRSAGGAVLHYHQSGGLGDGGHAHMMQTDIRRARVLSTTLTVAPTAGVSTTITVASATGMVIGDKISIGTGSTGATGGEVLYITNIAGNVLTIKRPTGETTVARSHAIGEPAYIVPSAYINMNPFYMLWWGANDLAARPITGAASRYRRCFIDAYRLVIARARCSEIYEQDHTSCTYTGTWGAHVASTGSNSGPTIRQATAVNAAVTIHVPDNFPGGTIALSFPYANVTNGSEHVWTFTVDGVAAGTHTLYETTSGKLTGACKRLTGLTAGRHTIVAQLTSFTSGAAYFDWWGIEGPTPPLVLVPGMNRPTRYDLWGASWANQPRTTQLNGAEAVGQTVITVDSTTGMLIGQTVTFEEGLANAESGEVLTVDSGTQFTLVSPLTLSHADNSAVKYGIQDADVPKLNAILQALVAEFDSGVVYVDTDAILNKNPDYFWHDGVHFNDAGHAKLTKEAFFDAIMNAPAFSPDMTSYTSVPVAPLPCAITFLTATVTATDTTWATMPAALTELFGATLGPSYRQRADLRRAFEWRFIGHVRTAGATGSSLRLRYSIDGGTTFRYLGRSALHAEDGTVGALVITSTGEKDSGWQPFPADALADNVVFQIIGIGGNGAASPVFGNIYLMFR